MFKHLPSDCFACIKIKERENIGYMNETKISISQLYFERRCIETLCIAVSAIRCFERDFHRNLYIFILKIISVEGQHHSRVVGYYVKCNPSKRK
jgi:hypothetical protein